ncbi:LamG-like jellyroll fold domain-containing protein [Streptomyces tibetensis]|uniref:LamG-like jellyroll fold domain-containing protein n=1 Tax=Streptomyces tibetensis TaxID=2382123 RepID=UPI0033F271BE
MLTLPAQASVAADAEQSAPVSEGHKALQEAQQSGHRVEVTGERTERTTVFANPDGYTFTLEESAVPVRVAAPDGGWQAPDATLVKRSDGTVVPKAAAAEMEFSGGGTKDALVRIANAGRSLELDWPGELPVPHLDESSAVYPDVLPDIDLKLTATAESFQQVLVVKTPQAAASDELKKLTFGLKTTGLWVQEGASGNLAAVDENGRTVFKAPPARMWDSAGEATTHTQLQAREEVSSGEVEPSDPSETAPSGSGLEPGQGDTVARMDVEVDKTSLSVIPDTDMLSATEASAFPLFIDPTVTWGESERTLLRSDGYESYGWSNGDDDMGKGVGECETWNGYYCGPGYVQRLYFEFSSSSLKGKKVLDATFRVTEPWAFQCDPRWVDLVRTSNVSSSTTWSTRPTHLDLMVDRHVSAGRGSLCDPDSPDAPIEFNDNPDEANENLTSTVRDFAAGKFDRLTLMLKAHDETDTAAWKRFKNDAVLAVDFVGLPDKPTGVGLVTGAQTGWMGRIPVCERDASDPAIVSDPSPSLAATAQTKPGGEKDAQLRVYFDVDERKSDGSWADSPAGNGDLRPASGYALDDTKLTLEWSKLLEGTVYRYRAWVRSYYNAGNSYVSGPSNASTTGWCYFKIDQGRPKAPTITIGLPYTECTANDCAAHGGPGVKGTFTFTPATGDTGNTGYQYKLTTEDEWSDPFPGSTVSVPITPNRAGTHSIYVRAKDTLGWGEQAVVDFLVGVGAAPVARYHFNEADGAAVDSATQDGKDDATLASGAARHHSGRRGLLTHDAQGQPLAQAVTDRGLLLDGTSNGYAATAGPVLETRSSYTVAAWVRVDPSVTQTVSVLSQTPTVASPWTQKYSPFVISYGGKWSIRAFSTDGTFTREAAASVSHPKGVWTHVAAVHDTAAKKIHLFVNGKREASADAGTPWSAEGDLQIGRVMFGDSYVDHFKGVIDEVAVWQRTLTDQEVRDEARLLTSEHFAGVELVGGWLPEQGTGTTIPDTLSGYGRKMTLNGGASLNGDEITLDGVDDSASVAGPLVDDTGSFTVTALATLDEDKLAGKNVGYKGQVIGQRTADGSAWGLWYELTGKQTVLDPETLTENTVPVGFWRFGRVNADGTFSAVSSDESALMDGRVRLTGVFDAQDGTISLYLGGARNDEPRSFTAKLGTGEFTVGRGFTGGVWQHYLPEHIGEVRVWAGAMAGWEQIEQAVGD